MTWMARGGFSDWGRNPGESNESGYTSEDSVVRATAGINFLHSWRATLGARFRQMTTKQNIIPDIPDMATPVLRDCRDRDAEHHGGEFGSSGTAETCRSRRRAEAPENFLSKKRTWPWGAIPIFSAMGWTASVFSFGKIRNMSRWSMGFTKRPTGRISPFTNCPAWAGGTRLRGFGDGRFVDRGRLVFNVEHRITLASMEMMGIQANFEVAPFFDLGSVFPDIQDIKSKNFRPVCGGAFRVAVKPNVVGDVEVGRRQGRPGRFRGYQLPLLKRFGIERLTREARRWPRRLMGNASRQSARSLPAGHCDR